MYEQQIKEIAERLHGLRDALELTQEQAAEKLGIEAFAENTHTYDLMTPAMFLERAAMAAKRIRLMVDGF